MVLSAGKAIDTDNVHGLLNRGHRILAKVLPELTPPIICKRVIHRHFANIAFGHYY